MENKLNNILRLARKVQRVNQALQEEYLEYAKSFCFNEDIITATPFCDVWTMPLGNNKYSNVKETLLEVDNFSFLHARWEVPEVKDLEVLLSNIRETCLDDKIKHLKNPKEFGPFYYRFHEKFIGNYIGIDENQSYCFMGYSSDLSRPLSCRVITEGESLHFPFSLILKARLE